MNDREFTETNEPEENSSFADFELDDEQTSEVASEASEYESSDGVDQPEEITPKSEDSVERIRGVSAAAQGALFVTTTLVTAAGLGFGVMFALGGQLNQLFDLSGLTKVDQILAFDAHPTNLLLIIIAGVLLLTMLATSAVTRATKSASKKYIQAETKLNQIGKLDLNEPDDWQNKILRDDSRLTEFLATTLGSYRLLKNKQVKSVGLEGELRRLEMALDKGSRIDLACEYSDPLIGGVADQILELLDKAGKAKDELGLVQERYKGAGDSFINLIQNARGWNNSTLDKLNVQAVAVERLTANVAKLSEAIRNADIEQQDQGELEKQISAIKANLAALPAEGLDKPVTDSAAVIVDMSDRGSKLAFQIAMEVARLGPKGERLLPMTQDLEEITTEFRTMADNLKASATQQQQVSEVINQTRNNIDSLPVGADQEMSGGEELKKLMVMAGELAPMSQKVSAELTALAHGFNGQTELLTQLGVDCSQIFDTEFIADDMPVTDLGSSGSGLETSQFDPFQSSDKDQDEVPFQTADPFAAAPDSVMGDAPTDQPDLGLTTTNQPEMSEMPEVESTAAPANEDRVYDLAEFDAVRVDQENAGDDAGGDRVYDLTELGGVTLT